MKKIVLCLIIIASFHSFNLYSQIVINEISNNNTSAVFDENNEAHDWIELYNSGSTTINLHNYTLSDDSTNLFKWAIPNIEIAPFSYLVIMASGKDTLASFPHTNFKLSSVGEKIILCDADKNIIEYYYLRELQNNHSIGRKPDGSSNWGLFDAATPGVSNNNSNSYDGYEIEPFFSLNAGFYPSARVVELYTPSATGTVRFTLDGSSPSASSDPYLAAIGIPGTKVVSARCFSNGNLLPSKTVKKTYFIDDGNMDLPVFSITMDPEDLWDDNTGIYVNYEQDWEKKCHIEFFDKQKIKQFELDAGIKIQGNYSRGKDQKSFRILTRKEYGTAWLEYPLIPEKPYLKKYKRFNLRNSGGDYNYARMRDAFMQRALKDSPVDRMASEPALVFLNGEYWGHYEIREQQNTKYLLTNRGIPEDQVDFLYHKGSKVRPSAGTDIEFYVMYDQITQDDPQKLDFYGSANEKLDLENFTDYMIAGIYYSNPDWIDHTAAANNIRLWRQRVPQGKWRYMFWDLDMGSGLYNKPADINNLSMVRNPDEDNVHSDIFRNLLLNTQFQHSFVNRYADLMNTVFQHDNLQGIAYEMRDAIDSSIPRHKAKWGGTYEKWYSDVDKMVDWHIERMIHARSHIQTEFNLTQQVEITLATYPAEAGRIKINSIVPNSLPWKGVYYDGVPVTVTVIPNPGFTFQNWLGEGVLSNPEFNPSLTINLTSNDTLTAYFTGSAVDPKLAFSEINYHSEIYSDAGDWVELHNYDNISVNLTGWYIKDGNDDNKFEIPFGTILPPNGYMVFSCDTLLFKSQHPGVSNFKGQLAFNFKNSSDQVRLFKYDNSLFLSVGYSDSPPWPAEADGKGKTLELSSPDADPNLASSWFAGCDGGSPGKAYDPLCLTEVSEVYTDNLFRLYVWPNPSRDIINISVLLDNKEMNDISFLMYDFTGREVKNITSFKNNKLQIKRDEFTTGIYIIKVGNGQHFLTEKIIFQ